jgi:hypothetical protein
MPADTDLPDTLVLGLTSHHLLLAAPGAAAIFLGALLGALGVIPLPAVAVGVLVVGAATAGVVACNPDGLTYDRFLRARRRHRRAPAVEVAADVLAALPAWTGAGGSQAASLGLPWDGLDGGGVVALGRDESRTELGFAAVLRLAALDQEALDREAIAKIVASLGVWLSALDCDAQVLVRSRPLELSARIAELEVMAARVPAPVLAEIAAARAEALRGVAATAPKCLTAYVVLRWAERHGLADRVRRLTDILSGAGVSAEAVPAGELAEMLGGRALGTGDALWPAPDEIERVGDAGLRVGTRCCATYRAAAYPSQVEAGWLTPVLRSGAELDLAVHIAPEDRGAALHALRRQFGRLSATEAVQTEGGDLADPGVEGAASDAARLHGALGHNETRTFRAGLYVTVWGDDVEAVATAGEDVEVAAEGIMLDLRPVIFAPVSGWVATRPLALDPIRRDRRVDTEALAATLPVWTGEATSDPGGSLVGYHPRTGVPVFCDRFALGRHRPNAHKLIVAPSGSGKSYEIKGDVASLMLAGVAVHVVDWQDEYIRLAEALGGTVIRLGTAGARINPFELAEAAKPSAVTQQSLFVESVVETMLGELDPSEKAALGRAISSCYRLAGITADPATHDRTPPELLDLLAALEEARADRLAALLEPWSVGAYAGLCSGQTTLRPAGELVVWALGELPGDQERLAAVAVLLAVHAIWTEVARRDGRRRVVVLDEAWRLYEVSAAAGRVVEGLARRLAKGARKYNCGLTNATQDLDEFLATPLGRTILNNSSVKWLPGQEPAGVKALGATFGLGESETRYLEGAARGHGLLLVGRQRIRLEVRATPVEHRLATSDPEEVAAIDAEELRSGAEKAVRGWVVEVATGRAAGCRHRVVDLEGDWLAGEATAGVELVWTDAEDGTWSEWATLQLARSGRSWDVTGAVRARRPA